MFTICILGRDDSFISESENDTYMNKLDSSQMSNSMMGASQTDVDAGYNTDERNEIKQAPNFLAKTYELVNVSIF